MGEVEKAALRETHQRLYGGSARRPKFSPLFQANSKLFQGKSKLFQAFSKEFQTFSLAVSNEINGLAAPPGDFAFFEPCRANCPMAKCAFVLLAASSAAKRRRSWRWRRGEPRRASIFRLPRLLFFRKTMSRRPATA
ncbi:MAG: hypothetical protein WAU78_17640, partial [Roseiarcus sp.]